MLLSIVQSFSFPASSSSFFLLPGDLRGGGRAGRRCREEHSKVSRVLLQPRLGGRQPLAAKANVAFISWQSQAAECGRGEAVLGVLGQVP